MSDVALAGAEFVLELADRIRRLGAGTAQPHRLHDECIEAARRGEISFDAITPLYRHAMYHAGAIAPRDRDRFHICPVCETPLDVPADEGQSNP